LRADRRVPAPRHNPKIPHRRLTGKSTSACGFIVADSICESTSIKKAPLTKDVARNALSRSVSESATEEPIIGFLTRIEACPKTPLIVIPMKAGTLAFGFFLFL